MLRVLYRAYESKTRDQKCFTVLKAAAA